MDNFGHKMIGATFLLIASLVSSTVTNPLDSEEVNVINNIVLRNITNDIASIQLYNSVVAGDYRQAVVKAFALENSGRGHMDNFGHKMIAAILLLIASLVRFTVTNSVDSEEVNVINNIVLPNITNNIASTQLYNSVVAGDYRQAVVKAFALENSGRGEVIISVVNRLVNETKSNIIDFAYKLWNMFGEEIVKDYFPIEFQLILNNNRVQLINGGKDITLYYELEHTDNSYKLRCYENRGNLTFTVWKFTPVWEDNFVYFKIYNTGRNEYLDFSYISNVTKSKEWYLKPTMFKNELLFQIYSRAYNISGLSCSPNHDLFNIRLITDVELYGWRIKPLASYN